MATWVIQGTDKKEEGTEEGFKRINAVRNKDKSLKDKTIVFVDDKGDLHEDVNNLTSARKADLLGKEKEAQGPVLSSIFLQVSGVVKNPGGPPALICPVH